MFSVNAEEIQRKLSTEIMSQKQYCAESPRFLYSVESTTNSTDQHHLPNGSSIF